MPNLQLITTQLDPYNPHTLIQKVVKEAVGTLIHDEDLDGEKLRRNCAEEVFIVD